MNNLSQEIKDLVIARLQRLPDDMGVSIGSFGDFTKDELINHVRSSDDVGQKIIEVEMTFLKAMKEGIFYGTEFASSN